MDKLTSAKVITHKLFTAFPECGIITIARMAMAHELKDFGNQSDLDFYKNVALDYFNEHIA